MKEKISYGRYFNETKTHVLEEKRQEEDQHWRKKTEALTKYYSHKLTRNGTIFTVDTCSIFAIQVITDRSLTKQGNLLSQLVDSCHGESFYGMNSKPNRWTLGSDFQKAVVFSLDAASIRAPTCPVSGCLNRRRGWASTLRTRHSGERGWRRSRKLTWLLRTVTLEGQTNLKQTRNVEKIEN